MYFHALMDIDFVSTLESTICHPTNDEVKDTVNLSKHLCFTTSLEGNFIDTFCLVTMERTLGPFKFADPKCCTYGRGEGEKEPNERDEAESEGHCTEAKCTREVSVKSRRDIYVKVRTLRMLPFVILSEPPA